MNLNSDFKTSFTNYGRLLNRIEDLMAVINKMSTENKELKNKVVTLEGKLTSEKESGESYSMKEELKNLKNENKRLKEKESKIKTKIERLAVKLEQIHL